MKNKLLVWILIILTTTLIFCGFVYADDADNNEFKRIFDTLKILFSFSNNQENKTVYPSVTINPYPTYSTVSITPNQTQTLDNNILITASSLVTQIQKYCQSDGVWGRIDMRNFVCTSLIDPPLGQTAKQILAATVFRCCYFLQCTGFVQTLVYLNTGKILEGRLLAKLFYYFPPNGYRAVSKSDPTILIKPGDLAIWGYSATGHIAYVTQVYSPNYFRIAEANFDFRGRVQERNVSLDSPKLLGWLTPI